MVEGGRAAMLDQFRHGRHGRVIEAILIEPRENRINPVQPFDHRKLGPVQIGTVADEGLEKW